MFDLKKLWNIETNVIHRSKDLLLQFDKLKEKDIYEIWYDDERIAKHMANKFTEYDYDPSFFFSSGCDMNNQFIVFNRFSFNANFLEVVQMMNFFFWVKNSLGLWNFKEWFNDKNINDAWTTWRNNWHKIDSEKTISFFFKLPDHIQKTLIEKYQNYMK